MSRSGQRSSRTSTPTVPMGSTSKAYHDRRGRASRQTLARTKECLSMLQKAARQAVYVIARTLLHMIQATCSRQNMSTQNRNVAGTTITGSHTPSAPELAADASSWLLFIMRILPLLEAWGQKAEWNSYRCDAF